MIFRISVWLILVAVLAITAHGDVVAYRLEVAGFAPPRARVEAGERLPRLIANSRVIMRHFPLPRTELPLYLYLRVKPGNEGDAVFLEMEHDGKRQRLTELSGTMTPGRWQWIALPPFNGRTEEGTVRMDVVPSPSGGRAMELDAMVVSSQPDLEVANLETVEPLLSGPPLASVFRTATPPAMDAAGNDPIWEQALPIRDFLSFVTHQPASLETTARFLYDERQLYLQWVVEEPLLRAADMKIEELITHGKERDQTSPHDLLGDDACYLILRPPGEKTLYEIVVNSLGVYLDARLHEGDLWKSRDVSWNGAGIRVAHRRHEARWISEVAIPFSALDKKAPLPGEKWKVAIGRLAPGRKEFASWNRSGRGAHLPEEWGELRFSAEHERLEAYAKRGVTQLDPGRNELEFDLREGVETAPVVFTSLDEGDARRIVSEGAPDRDGQYHFEIGEFRQGGVRWGILEAREFELHYRSPRASVRVASSEVTVHIETSGAFQLFVNESLIANGQGVTPKLVKIRLAEGANVLRLQAESGKAAVWIEGEPGEIFGEVWEVIEEEESSDRPRRTRQNARRGLKADEGKRLLAECTLLHRHTVIWPVPEPSLTIAREMAQPVSFRFNGLPGRDLGEWKTWVAIPAGLKVGGVSGYYGETRAQQPRFEVAAGGEVTIGGEVLSLYEICADRPLFYDKVHPPGGRTGIFHLMLEVSDDDAGRALERGEIYFWSQAWGGAVSERRESFSFRTLPAVRGRQPKTYVFELWGSNFGNLDSEPVRHQIFSAMQRAGFNLLVDLKPWTVSHGKDYGIAVRPALVFAFWSINLQEHLAKYPQEQVVRHDGTRHSEWLCTTLLLGERWEIAEGAITRVMRENGFPSACYDYEYNPWTGPHSCFCPRCLEQFAKTAGITGELTPKRIDREYRAQWDDYMARQGARVMAKMRQAVKAAVPGGFLTVFSLPQMPRTVAVYGVDWRYVVEEGGADVIQIGTGGPWEMMMATSAIAGTIPIMYGVWITPYGPDDLSPARTAGKAELLRRVLDSNYGVIFYDRATMDGASWLNVGEVTRLVSDYESVFLTARPEAVDGLPLKDAQWMHGPNESLLCLMNHGTEGQTFTVELPSVTGELREYFTGKVKSNFNAPMKVTLPPDECAVYILPR